jgi:two-component system response regulator HydG
VRRAFHGGSGLDRTLDQVEAERIRLVLDRLRGNKSRAAKRLGIDRRILREKLRRFGLGAEK